MTLGVVTECVFNLSFHEDHFHTVSKFMIGKGSHIQINIVIQWLLIWRSLLTAFSTMWRLWSTVVYLWQDISTTLRSCTCGLARSTLTLTHSPGSLTSPGPMWLLPSSVVSWGSGFLWTEAGCLRGRRIPRLAWEARLGKWIYSVCQGAGRVVLSWYIMRLILR